MQALSKPELDSLLKVAKNSSPADYLMIALGFFHGLRVSEILALTPDHFCDGHLTIQRSKGSCKTTQKLSPATVAALMTYMKDMKPNEHLFPTYRTKVWRKMQKLGAKAGISAFKCHPHVLKHTCATLGLKGGMTLPQVQTRLGHKCGSNTMIYLRVDDEQASDAFAAAVQL